MVFRVTAGGAFTSFAGLRPSDASPFHGGPFVQGADGSLYGTANNGGDNQGFERSYGTIFRVSAEGVVTRLAVFKGTNGASPRCGLTRGHDGNLYGTTTYGAADYKSSHSILLTSGTVFRLNADGSVATLVYFNGTNGAHPEAPLVSAADGSLYGTTIAGGAGSVGTVFRVTTDGTLKTLFAFDGTNGVNPYCGLVQGPDATFYGTTARGGAQDYGTVFSITPEGSFSTLASFNGKNGTYPYAGLILASDGALYGTTAFGGPGFDGTLNSGDGTVFRFLPSGDVTTVGTFGGTNGARPFTGVIEGADGYLYGTATYGGSHEAGNVYRVAKPIRLQLTSRANGEWLLAWNGILGLTYQPQFGNDCLPALWTNLGPPLVATERTLAAIDVPTAGACRFYRIIESP
jgi:uncharacterized repeat protein (TIGR03803 family)